MSLKYKSGPKKNKYKSGIIKRASFQVTSKKLREHLFRTKLSSFKTQLDNFKSKKRRGRSLNNIVIQCEQHHLISVESVASLLESRKKMLIKRSYSINHMKNLVILPGDPEIACHYGLPLHYHNHGAKSGPVADSIVKHYYDESGESQTLANSAAKSETTRSTHGYHKIVTAKLSSRLKTLPIDCDIEKHEFLVDRIDKLSGEIINDISDFILLLGEHGEQYKLTGDGCCVTQLNYNSNYNGVCDHRDHGFELTLSKEDCFDFLAHSHDIETGTIDLKTVYDMRTDLGFSKSKGKR